GSRQSRLPNPELLPPPAPPSQSACATAPQDLRPRAPPRKWRETRSRTAWLCWRRSHSLLHQHGILRWARDFAAHAGRGKQLLRIQHIVPVERIPQADHDIEVLLGEQHGHEVALLHPDAVLAGDRATRGNAPLQYLCAGLQGALKLVGKTDIEKYKRMKIAISRMEDVADDQVVLLGHIPDVSKYRGNLAAWHDSVLRVIRRTHPPQRAEGCLAALPQQRALLFSLGAAHLTGLLLQTDLPHCFRLLFHGFA